MPFNSVFLVSMANKSAELWQQLASLPERMNSDDMVDLVICFPLQQLGRWALYVWTYLCVSPYPHRHHYTTSYHGDDSDDDSDDDGGGVGGGGASSSGNNEYQYYCYSNQNSRGYDYSSHSD